MTGFRLALLCSTALAYASRVTGVHVALVCTFGTRSDVAPVFEGLRDLATDREHHTITYLTIEGIARDHAAEFPYIQTRLIENAVLPAYFTDPNDTIIADLTQTHRVIDNTQLILAGMWRHYEIYETNVVAFMAYFRAHPFDLVLCDAAELACMDAAKEVGLKVAIYGPLGQYGVGEAWYVPDFLSPMPIKEWIHSPWKRAKSYIDVLPVLWNVLRWRSHVMSVQTKLGMQQPYQEPWDHLQKNLWLAHHVLGVDLARSLPNNVLVFGPVVHEEGIPPLEPEIHDALDQYERDGVRAIFMAFGSTLTLKDSPELYSKMLRSIDTLLTDKTRRLAVIWASRFHNASLTTPIQARHPGRFLTPSWANQRRVLRHNATALLLSHGGYGSMVEAMYTGKELLMVPLFFDQYVNAVNAEEAGVALSMNKYTLTSDEMTTKITHLLDQATTVSTIQTRQKWMTICRINSAIARTTVAKVVLLAATVGVDHLVSPDVYLSLFDRFDVVTVVGTVLVLVGTYKWVTGMQPTTQRTITK